MKKSILLFLFLTPILIWAKKPLDNSDVGVAPDAINGNISFADANVKALCVANWDTNSDGELSMNEAAAVTDLGTEFQEAAITSFDELQYFTGLTSIGGSAFHGCSGLTSITIPSSVTSIGGSAFYGCRGLTSITIPSSVTSIGNDAFFSCRGLASISVDSSNQYYNDGNGSKCIIETSTNTLVAGCKNTVIPSSVTSIGSYAFSGCSGLTSITIPSSVSSIGRSAFYGCSGLTSITIPSSVTSIGGSAFSGCSGLTSITIPSSVTSIGSYAFSGCSGLTSITIPSSVTSIGSSAFSGCSGLTSITIPSSVTSIGSSAFFGCSGLTSITIPSSVTSIGDYAFYRCSGLTSITSNIKSPFKYGSGAFNQISSSCVLYVPAGTRDAYIAKGWTEEVFKGGVIEMPENIDFADANVKALCVANWDTNGDGELSMNEAAAVTDLGDVFKEYRTITSFDELQYFTGLTSIGGWAFSNITGLTSITIPSSVTSIGGYAFHNCSGLTSITIPSSVTSIVGSAFFGCSGLASITIPSSVTSIDGSAFFGCSGLASISVDSSNQYYNDGNGSNCIIRTLTNILVRGCKNTVIPSSVTSIGGSAFSGCSGLTSITIPSSVTSIGGSAFSSCTNLTSITIPSSVTSIGNQAFYSCIGLTSIIVGSSNRYYNDGNGSNCIIETSTNTLVAGCKNTVIPEGVTTIKCGAFYLCPGMTSITIPKSITSIEGGAFSNCSDLTSITSYIKDPFELDSYAFNRISSSRVLYVPAGTRDAYIAAGWTEDVFKGGVIEMPENIDFADNNVKALCVANWDTNGDGELSMSEAAAVTDLGRVFNENITITSFDELQYFTGVTSIGEIAFHDCDSLTSISIPESVVSIGKQAFWGCIGLSSITIPDGVISIGDLAFAYCDVLTSITIPSSVTSIGTGAFVGCPCLTSISVDSSNQYYNDGNGSNCIIETSTNILVRGCKNTVIPSSVTSIGIAAFDRCHDLTSITIPSSVTSIGYSAFYDCTGLTSITIPSSVTSIGNQAFYSCSGLTSITIPSSVTSIGGSAFYGCTGLTSITSNIKSPFKFGSGAFNQISSSCVLYVPAGTRDAYIAAGWTEEVFKGGVIEMPENIDFADANVKALCVANWDSNGDGELSMNEAAAVTDLGSIFKGNKTITSFDELQYFTGLTSIGFMAFNGCSGLTSITIPESVTLIGYSFFSGCSGLTSITIPESVTSIGYYAFSGCTGLTSITIPSSVTSIGGSAFSGCTGLTSISVDSSNQYYNDGNGSKCIIETSTNALIAGCKNTVIPSNVTSIGGSAFSGCTGLTSITIPSSVTSIGTDAFAYCSGLTSITSYIKNPFKLESDAFSGIPSSCVLYVPAGTRDAYIAAGWTEEVFKGGVIEMPDPSVNEDTDISGMANVIYAENISVRKGNSTTLEIKMNNELIPTGCTFSITLPEGLSLVTDADGDVVCSTTDRSRKMSVIQAQGGSSIYNFALTPSTENATISGTSGTIMTLKLRADENMETGDYKVSMKKNSVSYKSGGMTADNQLSDIIRTITVEDYLMGDVNSDGQISLADAVMILYHYFGVSQTGFKEKAADVTDDGNISLADAIEVLYKYFGMDVNWVKERPSQMIDPD